MSDISRRIQAVLREVFDDDTLVLRSNLTPADVENWDSVTHFDLIAGIEREFKVKFTTAEVVSLANIGDLQSLVEKKLDAR